MGQFTNSSPVRPTGRKRRLTRGNARSQVAFRFSCVIRVRPRSVRNHAEGKIAPPRGPHRARTLSCARARLRLARRFRDPSWASRAVGSFELEACGVGWRFRDPSPASPERSDFALGSEAGSLHRRRSPMSTSVTHPLTPPSLGSQVHALLDHSYLVPAEPLLRAATPAWRATIR